MNNSENIIGLVLVVIVILVPLSLWFSFNKIDKAYEKQNDEIDKKRFWVKCLSYGDEIYFKGQKVKVYDNNWMTGIITITDGIHKCDVNYLNPYSLFSLMSVLEYEKLMNKSGD